MYSYLVSDEIILTSLDAGAVSYVAKSESGNHLCEAIYAACTDTPYVAPRMAKALLRDRTVGRPRLSSANEKSSSRGFRPRTKRGSQEALYRAVNGPYTSAASPSEIRGGRQTSADQVGTHCQSDPRRHPQRPRSVIEARASLSTLLVGARYVVDMKPREGQGDNAEGADEGPNEDQGSCVLHAWIKALASGPKLGLSQAIRGLDASCEVPIGSVIGTSRGRSVAGRQRNT